MTTLTSVGLDNNDAVYLIGVENNKWVINSASNTNALTLSNQYTIGEGVTSVSGSYIVSSSVTENAGQYTYTINVIDSESNTLLVSGSHTGVSKNGVTSGYFGGTNVMLGFGGHFGDGESPHAVGEYSNVKIYNAVIPEPTTATLSLLALCGLAARRRRK